VPALHLCLSHENRHSPAGLQRPGAAPREERPKGILGSCDMALRNASTSAMGTSPDDFVFVVEDVLEEYQEAQPEFADMQAPSTNRAPNFS
jgi:hypothetical protein